MIFNEKLQKIYIFNLKNEKNAKGTLIDINHRWHG
jgi:hypothetical protein